MRDRLQVYTPGRWYLPRQYGLEMVRVPQDAFPMMIFRPVGWWRRSVFLLLLGAALSHFSVGANAQAADTGETVVPGPTLPDFHLRKPQNPLR